MNAKVRPGNPYLEGALDLAAFGAVRTEDTYLQARHKRLTSRRGPLRALVSVEHSIIAAIWHMLTDNVPYHELGGTNFTQRAPNAPPAARSTSSTSSATPSLSTEGARSLTDNPGHLATPRPPRVQCCPHPS
ncbi:hypothetical protein [Streptomyces bicolor]|uniref:hypothetical protein n=1 Tax=Streptomyces bicolor TaxID=66874 RepID=UPI0004E11AE1|nr:hypothetical protein [Streptomyces bicolor]